MTSPLAGRRVVNTRALPQATELDELLLAHGAIPLSFPCIAVRPPRDPAPLDAALRDLAAGRFDWLLLTSANTVTALAARLVDREPHASVLPRPTIHLPPSVRLAAIGPATADAAARLLGWPVAFRPPAESAASLARSLPLGPGDRVLLPQSAVAAQALGDILRARGASVTTVAAYETTVGAGGVDVASMLAAGQVDAVCFTSGSTVRGCVERLGGTDGLAAVTIACIGPETAQVARSLDLRVDAVPARHTAADMVAALATSFGTGER